MADTSGADAAPSSLSTVSITVLSIKPVKFGRIFAPASVEIDIDSVVLVIHGVRAIRAQPMGTRVDLPVFRDENGVWQRATTPTRSAGRWARPCLISLPREGWRSKARRCDVAFGQLGGGSGSLRWRYQDSPRGVARA